MNDRLPFICALPLIVIHGCSEQSPPDLATNDTSLVTNNADGSKSPRLVMRSGFEGSTRIDPKANGIHYLLSGNDGPSAGYPSDWQADLEKATPYFPDGRILNAEQGTEAQRNVAIVADPDPVAGQAGNSVLRMRIVEKHIVTPTGEAKARLQHEIVNKNAPPPGGFIKEYYQKVRLYFSPSFRVLTEAPTNNIGWMVMQEFWNDPQWDQPNGDGTFRKRHEARTGIEIVKRNGALIFGAKGRDPIMEVPKPGNNSWEVYRDDFPIPLGKWMTQEIYVKEGDSTHGRFYMSISVDGQKTVIVDKVGMTTSEEPGAVPDGQTAWSPMKIYTEGRVVDWFSQHKDASGTADPKAMDVYWDDLEIWLNRTPETVLGGTPAGGTAKGGSPEGGSARGGVQVIGLGGLCLDAAERAKDSGTQMVVASCDGSTSQRFDFTAAGQLRPRHSSESCVDVSGGSAQDNARIQLWECNGTLAQRWTLSASGELRGPGDKCIDVDMASTAPGTKVKLLTCKGNDAQRWALTP